MNEMLEALRTADEYMNNLKGGVIQAVNHIESEEEGQGIGLIPDIADGIGWVLQVIDLTKEVQKEEIVIEDLNEKLEEVIEALENDDYILVGDLLKYEIVPILEEIHIGIRKTIEN